MFPFVFKNAKEIFFSIFIALKSKRVLRFKKNLRSADNFEPK